MPGGYHHLRQPPPQVKPTTFIPNYSQVLKTNTPQSIPNYSQVKKVDTPGYTSQTTQQSIGSQLGSLANSWARDTQDTQGTQHQMAPSYDYSQRYITNQAPQYININMPPIQPFESLTAKLIGGSGGKVVDFERWERPAWNPADPYQAGTPSPAPPKFERPTGTYQTIKAEGGNAKLLGSEAV